MNRILQISDLLFSKQKMIVFILLRLSADFQSRPCLPPASEPFRLWSNYRYLTVSEFSSTPIFACFRVFGWGEVVEEYYSQRIVVGRYFAVMVMCVLRARTHTNTHTCVIRIRDRAGAYLLCLSFFFQFYSLITMTFSFFLSLIYLFSLFFRFFLLLRFCP